MFKILAGTIVAGIALGVAVPHASAFERTYTDVKDCRSIDLRQEEFIHACKGPNEVNAVLYYFDGRAVPMFGEAGGWFDDEIGGEPYNADEEPLTVGGKGKVYGPKIEWTLAEGGRPCAATVRIGTNKGSRLVVTALGDRKGRVGVVKGNKEAQAKADGACKEHGAAPAPREFIEMKTEERQADDPLLKRLWGKYYKDAIMPGEEKRIYGFVGEVRLEDGRLVQASMFPDRMYCNINKCPVTVLIDDKIVSEENLLCDTFDINILKSGDILKSCGEEISLVSGQ
ncbi:hypothetical protein [Mesorhizobium sp. A556]